MGKPIESLMGDPTKCKIVSEDIAMHWYPKNAKKGDKCFCGKSTMKKQS